MRGKYIDFHAHVLPRADHGSDGIEVSTRQLELAEQAGVEYIIATPHFYPHSQSIESFLRRREEAYLELSAVKKEDIKVICGAEVLLCEGLHNMPELESLKIGDSNTILIEMPDAPWTMRLADTLTQIVTERGLSIVLAHVDRYPQKDVEELFSLGFQGQLNASALHSIFGRRILYKWIDRGCVVALGSDIHGEGKAYKEYSKAMQLLGERGDKMQALMHRLVINTGGES